MKTKFDFVKTPGYNPLILGDPTLTPLAATSTNKLMSDPLRSNIIVTAGQISAGVTPQNNQN